MVLSLTTSRQCCSVAKVETERAWHILAKLLFIGRPASPEEIALQCGLFGASPEYVRYLCSIPDSPICLVGGGWIVTASAVVLRALEVFAVNAIGGCFSQIRIRALGRKRWRDTDVRTYFKRRKGEVDSVVVSRAKRRLCLPCENGEEDCVTSNLQSAFLDISAEVPVDISNIMIGSTSLLSVDLPTTDMDLGKLNKGKETAPLLLDLNAGCLGFAKTNTEYEVGKSMREVSGSVQTLKSWDTMLRLEEDLNIPVSRQMVRTIVCKSDMYSSLVRTKFENPVLCWQARTGGVERRVDEGFTGTYCVEAHAQHNASSVEIGNLSSCVSGAPVNLLIDDSGNKVEVARNGSGLIETKYALANGLTSSNPVNIAPMQKNQIIRKVDVQGAFPSGDSFIVQKYPPKSSGKLKSVNNNGLAPTSGVQPDSSSVVNSPKQEDEYKGTDKIISMKQKLKKSCKHGVQAKENMIDFMSPSPKVENKTLPYFESFIVEDEEGSGGYGTVYRAQRKSDGKRFAIKCPHGNAHRHHVNNELKILQRFGGRNSIIKFEETLKSGNSDSFVLEYVEHDRPEILKREIDIFQLQWYGYCMFRALACLHKQGVAHRDVKPGNFLFSRKLNKGYLIDFNLAMDLQHKYAPGSKLKSKVSSSFDHVPVPLPKMIPPTKERQPVRGENVAVSKKTRVDSKANFDIKNMKKRNDGGSLKSYPDSSGRTMFRNQGADGSGITSTKDVTSTRTPSAERLREPLPCLGRKELINLVQGAMLSLNNDLVNNPAPQRKRVSAPSGMVNSKLFYLSPMPLHSTGVGVAGAGTGLLKSKGDGKRKKEGPCVGTKGFRAPEVLFRSMHQSFKVDVWSAGVSLLYLMVGRTPFGGDPEQNIKDIAKLRGSEDLWEVAKLHNRESSFPSELLDIQFLPSIELQEWCKMNTRRPDFLKHIPESLFNLVDKCLTVNPRQRISAEEALRHEFFAPCHESLKKQRMLRHGLIMDQESDQSSQLLHGQRQVSLAV